VTRLPKEGHLNKEINDNCTGISPQDQPCKETASVDKKSVGLSQEDEHCQASVKESGCADSLEEKVSVLSQPADASVSSTGDDSTGLATLMASYTDSDSASSNADGSI
jgi:hypothetical protein